MNNDVIVIDKGVKGRGVCGIRNFSKNETIIEELPLVSCQFAWNKYLHYKACDHCLRPLETAEENIRRFIKDDVTLPYLELMPSIEAPIICECQVSYCSLECQQLAANLYHSILCFPPGTDGYKMLLKLDESWRNSHYPPESTSIMIVLRIYATIHQAQNKSEIIQHFSDFASDDSNPTVIDRFFGKFKSDFDKLRDLAMKCLQVLNLDIPDVLLTPKSFMKILSVLALNSQGIGTSPFAEWVAKVEEKEEEVQTLITVLYKTLEDTVGLDFLNNEGSGLYKLQSKINHSCDPNSEIIFPYGNHVLGIRTLQDIPVGEEITISYLDTCLLSRSRHSRNKALKESHLFSCLCAKCEADAGELDETSSDDDDDESCSEDDDNDVQMT